MIDILIYSHHLPAWNCIDIVRRNSVLVTCGSERVNEFGGDTVGRNKILVTLKGSKELNDEKKKKKLQAVS